MMDRHQDRGAAVLARAETLLQNGNADAAGALCSSVLSENPKHIDAIHLSARLAYAGGRIKTAVRLLRNAIHLAPQNSTYACDLGIALQAEGDMRAALACFRRAIDNDPDHWEAHFRCGVIEQEHGNLDAAASDYRRVVDINPGVAEAHNNLGAIYKARGDWPAAIACFNAALKILPDFIEAYHNLAEVHAKKGDWEAAAGHLEKIRALKPDRPDILIRIGDLFRDAGKLPAAMAQYRQALTMAPDLAVAHFKLGVCLGEREQYAQAMDHYRQAIQFKPDSPEPYINLGNLFAKLDQPAEAAPCYRKAIRLKPQAVKPYYFLGCVLRDMGDLQQSLTVTQKALEIDPSYAEARFSLALSLLLRGDYASGWRAYEARMKLKTSHGDYPYLGKRPLWDGGAFRGKTLLVQSEQGFGDILQFVRFLPLVKRSGGRVIFETYAPLRDLLRSFPGVDRLTCTSDGLIPGEAFDLYVPLMSVPARLGTLVDTIPADVPYLFADREKERLWRSRIDPHGLRVGIVWTGNPDYDKDRARSCRLADFESVSRLQGVRLFGLQKEVSEADRSLADTMGMCLLGDSFQDFSDTAAAIHQLDLVISVDTAVAHLAGAMGKPTWILLPKSPDFRWLTQRTDSPWYPTARLYRQDRQGDWTALLARVCRDVGLLATARR